MSNTKASKTHHERTFSELNIMDYYLLGTAALDTDSGDEFCRLLLSALLGKEIASLRVNVFNYLPYFCADIQGARMILRASKDAEFSLYIDAPFISAPSASAFAKWGRSRQSANDQFYLAKDIPAHLPDLYVINILPYDLFGKNYMLYHIQNSCREIPELDYPDGLQYLYFNTQGTKGGNPELRLLLDFMQESTEANARTPLLQALYRHVYTLRQRPDLYINYEYFKADVSFAQNELREKRTGL